MIANMLWVMSLRRSMAATIYLLAALAWAAAMFLSSLLGCEGGCYGDERHRLDLSLTLSWVGLALAGAAFIGSLLSRWLGFSLLAFQIVVFSVNLGIFWGLADSPWVFIPLGAIAGTAGYIAVGGLPPTPVNPQSS
jgi:hypothetical protein